MTDQYGRKIDYLRVSITDRCNFRCIYCMPNGIDCVKHAQVLSYEEFLRLCRIAVELGITKFKVTGGEPLVRKGCAEFIRKLKSIPGVEQVTLTTNGVLLHDQLDGLLEAGLDAVNISLDTLNEERFKAITGYSKNGVEEVLSVLEECCERGLKTKINAVLQTDTIAEAAQMVKIAERLPVDVRFIELMPIGYGISMKRVSPDEILKKLHEIYPDLEMTEEKRGNGPAHYLGSSRLKGKIGFIDAVSHRFCSECNRIRLTSTGLLKPCLCYDISTDLRSLLRSSADDTALSAAMRECISKKPRAHCFDELSEITEQKTMSQIGG